MKRKLKKGPVVVLAICLIVLLVIVFFPKRSKERFLADLYSMDRTKIEEYCEKEQLSCEFQEEYHSSVAKGTVLLQEPSQDTKISKGMKVIITLSLGEVPKEVYQENKVNEVGRVPIMMYHHIENIPSSETKYTGGNVDKDGYNRTAEAFRGDLEKYYQEGYRMIALKDYVKGIIDVPLGKSPIILTFDDGNEDNFKVLGKKEDGSLKIDPNCAIGILEEFKQKYPDYQVTATFFVMKGLFQQPEYNEDILLWLVDHGYDVGNHTLNHPDFTKTSAEVAMQEVGGMDQILNEIIPGKYVSIVALPFGSPYKKTHSNFANVLNGTYDGKSYQNIAALRVGWEADYSPFSDNFDPTFLKRIRAYDNNGVDFDIAYSLKQIQNTRYISDGDRSTIVVPDSKKEKIKETYGLNVITYDEISS